MHMQSVNITFIAFYFLNSRVTNQQINQMFSSLPNFTKANKLWLLIQGAFLISNVSKHEN